jgi:hypothetical protein
MSSAYHICYEYREIVSDLQNNETSQMDTSEPEAIDDGEQGPSESARQFDIGVSIIYDNVQKVVC